MTKISAKEDASKVMPPAAARQQNIKALHPLRNVINEISDIAEMDISTTSFRGDQFVYMDFSINSDSYRAGLHDGSYELRLNNDLLTDISSPAYLIKNTNDLTEALESVGDLLKTAHPEHSYPGHAEKIDEIVLKHCAVHACDLLYQNDGQVIAHDI